MNKTIAIVLGTVTLGIMLGCAAQPDDSKFLEPIPQQGEAALDIAGSQATGTTAQAASVHVQGIGGSGTSTTGFASFYEFTRQITDGVDTGTFAVVAAVAAVTETKPSSVTSTEAIWGPGGDALDPINWKVTVTETAPSEFEYQVLGRPHGDTKDSDFQVIVSGHGYGKSSPSYRSGSLTVFGDVMRSLDQSRSRGGTAKINYDVRGWPKTITADLTTSDGSGQWYDMQVTHGQDGSGALAMTALADVSTPKNGTNESVDELSRWNASGAGRADVKLSGGDYGQATALVSQCWSASFAATYYTDSIGYLPTSGDASTCAFSQATLNQ